ncbi:MULTISPECIES: hypothetical protein [Photorhabdus]|uniref:Uncharacterized protein n=2 Tax=Photorhabdus TaxID=29487 RepID=A0ABX0AU94_9GAMM|nr:MULTISPECIES: hypothetical protein [Photorhabdus]MCC8374476.1 hypothetical protein [Photorhabdus bodei]MCC8464510.1 hypothetical protein [Photorhabdus bodei]MCT8351478.1 hypothetical protein [Photorhabdus kayaii]MDB6366293.1 hypothetical protein [Photorhabdus bodei]MDB6370912.1 hypothetical protein [Photorhabdus bodei]
MTGVSECSQQRGNLKDNGYYRSSNQTNHPTPSQDRNLKSPTLVGMKTLIGLLEKNSQIFAISSQFLPI